MRIAPGSLWIPKGKNIVGCKRVFAVKFNSDGSVAESVARLKAQLVVKGYAQMYGVDYSNDFSPVVNLTSVRLSIYVDASRNWLLHRLYIKNAFL